IVVAGMLASSVADAAPGCDRRSSRSCKPAAAQTNPQAPITTGAQRAPAPTATRTRRIARHRHSLKHTQSAKPARRPAEQFSAPALKHTPESPPAAPHVGSAPESSPAARRFSEFVSPRPLAANPVEDLHKPSVAHAEPAAELSTASLVSRPADHDSPEGATSWIRIVFLAWGGLLTLGSALRLLIG